MSGRVRRLPEFREQGGRTVVPLEFSACGSWFVIFREPAAGPIEAGKNFPPTRTLAELSGAWDVQFDPAWGGPAHVRFEKLDDWTLRKEEGIRFYSGQASYRKQFDAPKEAAGAGRVCVDLGKIRELAEVRLNGRSLGIVWRRRSGWRWSARYGRREMCWRLRS